MASILGTQSGIYQPPRQRVRDANTQQAEASGAGQAANARADATVASATQTVLDPTQVRSRIAGLIDGQVASGGLTGNQAQVLKRVLGSTGADAGPAVDTAEAATVSSQAADSATPPSGQAAARQNSSEMLASFIRQLQTAQNQTSGYASDGSSEGTRLTSSRLLDFNT